MVPYPPFNPTQAALRNEERRLAKVEYLSSGAGVIDKVTRHNSMFNKGDLVRVVKVIEDLQGQERLVEEALSDESVIELFKEDGSKTGYFTTKEVREEERKILRLAEYIDTGSSNGFIRSKGVARLTSSLMEDAREELTAEQHRALQELLATDKGLHIIRGRAGVGKSYVLHQVAEIARAGNIYIIGVASTHKAKEVLRDSGFKQIDTVKGMLFKLHNARFSLPKHSLLVVDEAGMIDNDDYSELLRVAATRKCQVILSADERQLSSVQRGGMFEVLAGKYGSSTILDIKRQDSQWGRAVAMAFSKGDVRRGVAILEQEQRIKWQSDANKSMQSLLADWHKSSYAIEDRLIMAVRNKDVAALNHGVRQYLKLEGKLTGQEIAVAGNHYMKGDRILISKTNKELAIVNGEVGVIEEASRDRFVILLQIPQYKNSGQEMVSDSLDSGGDKVGRKEVKIIEFNPLEYSGFRHGYATSIFKSQGVSIKDVYVCNNGFAGLKNSYVALSRNISELNLYVNKAATLGQDSLIKQLSEVLDNGSSLNYLTGNEVKLNNENRGTLQNIGLVDKIDKIVDKMFGTYSFVERNITKIVDKYLPKNEYYNYQEPAQRTEVIEEVLDREYAENQQEVNHYINLAERLEEEKLVVGGNNIVGNMGTLNRGMNKQLSEIIRSQGSSSDKSASPETAKKSAKGRFYAKVEYQECQEQRSEENRERYRKEVDVLRSELKIKAESIVTNLLGKPNSKLSNRSTLKYGNNGSLSVKIAGEKAGSWYDFSEGRGGDLFDLVQREKYCDFKESVNYLQDKLGVSRNNNIDFVNDNMIQDIYSDYHKNKAREQVMEAAQIRKIEDLYARSKVIEVSSTAARYLSKTRKIDLYFDKERINSDVRTAYIYDKSLGKKASILIAFARDREGRITGGQQIVLDSKSHNKADIDISKRSFGRIAGSFVEVNKPDLGKIHNNITIIVEGIETALSIKYANVGARIICSLGISNIKNYQPVSGEKIIIAADNDGKESTTNKTI